MAKKKRGRPKKVKEEAAPFDNPTPSESLHAFPATIDGEEDSRSSSPVYQDISGWTAQQVADYFRDRGFVEEAQSMLDHVCHVS